MNTAAIINAAAKRAGLPLPLDDDTREFSEGFLYSLKSPLDSAHGRGPEPWVKGEDIRSKIARWKLEAEEPYDE
jgi:hypothetical protein